MKILAIEFSTGQRSVAIAVDGEIRSSAMETATRTTPAFRLIEETLREAKMEREEIECIALGLGPGSYTGIRSAIALAQGWQLALEIKLLGISSIECLAAEAQSQGCTGTVNIVMDAQRGELYFAQYHIDGTSLCLTKPLKLMSQKEVSREISSGQMIVGPDIQNWFKEGKPLHPTASILAQLAAGREDFLSGDKLEPIYLRETTFVKAPAPRILPPD